jgi:hypothetical protein
MGMLYRANTPPPPPPRSYQAANENLSRYLSMQNVATTYTPERNVMQPPRGKEPDPDGGKDVPRDGLDKPFFPKVEFEDEK